MRKAPVAPLVALLALAPAGTDSLAARGVDPAVARGAGPAAPEDARPAVVDHVDPTAAVEPERRAVRRVDLGPRPHYLVEDMREGSLKRTLQQCSEDEVQPTDFSIGHRGACLQFPEHTKESYMAAARMGAGVIECDVTFTRDLELVCRHSQCDLHTTTNILTTPLARKCTVPFTAAVLSPEGHVVTPASALCCTSDLTLAEFQTLEGKMDAYDPAARTPEEYADATPSWRTDLYAFPHHEGRWGGTLMTHAESIELLTRLGVGMTPELKSPSVEMPFGGLTQAAFAQKMIDAYKDAGVPPERVWPQSFRLDDILYWIENEPLFARQAVFLDGRRGLDPEDPATWSPTMEELTERGVPILAPPIWMLLRAEAGIPVSASSPGPSSGPARCAMAGVRTTGR